MTTWELYKHNSTILQKDSASVGGLSGGMGSGGDFVAPPGNAYYGITRRKKKKKNKDKL